MTVTSRGTSNKNQTGSAEDRRRRKRWLLSTWRADVDALVVIDDPDEPPTVVEVPHGYEAQTDDAHVEIACRCYRCGRLLIFATLEVDRIVPGKQGGTYRRDNIRPACGTAFGPDGCNQITGNELRWGKR